MSGSDIHVVQIWAIYSGFDPPKSLEYFGPAAYRPDVSRIGANVTQNTPTQ
jgi:hypothetical protein